MALITDRTAPADVPTTDELAKIPEDLLGFTPPAYLKFSATPAAMEEPPAFDDVETYCVRVKCVGEHGPLGRKDGERRYERSMSIQAIWKMGDPEPPLPPDPEEPQPALFGDDEPADEPEVLGDVMAGVDRPGFSDSGSEA
jgi:hypothetical protein